MRYLLVVKGVNPPFLSEVKSSVLSSLRCAFIDAAKHDNTVLYENVLLRDTHLHIFLAITPIRFLFTKNFLCDIVIYEF